MRNYKKRVGATIKDAKFFLFFVIVHNNIPMLPQNNSENLQNKFAYTEYFRPNS